MSTSITGRRRALAAFIPLALALAACSTGPIASTPAAEAPREEPLNVVRQYAEGATTSTDVPVAYFTVNVEVTDTGYEPAAVVIPAGRRVQLVFRNQGTAEHHFRVLGLVPEGLVFLASEVDEAPDQAPAGISDAEHAMHHSEEDVAFVPSRALTTPAGVRVTGDRVHAWALADGVDKVIFTAAKAGTFDVSDPRHPEIVGKLIVK